MGFLGSGPTGGGERGESRGDENGFWTRKGEGTNAVGG
jgi:hypothetical protein